jgi:hypothetical protein
LDNIRLGVSPEWADFLQLDIDGTTTLRLPVSNYAHDINGIDGLAKLKTPGTSYILFQTE